MNLTGLDLAVIAIPLLIVVGVTVYMMKFLHNVADFLVASRCAGRYLMCTSNYAGTSVMTIITVLEIFSQTGFSLRLWESFASVIIFLFGLLGLVSFRIRQCRVLTFHQLFELRYSKGVRVFASATGALSGLFGFGIQPAIGAKFFVYFCGLPERFMLGGVAISSFIPIMIILMMVSLCFALTGGRISVLVTDCLEGVVSSVFYLIIAFFILCTIPLAYVKTALTSGAPGSSFIDPFDIANRTDFNASYLVIGMFLALYNYKGNDFTASATSAHEGRMAEVLSMWRGYATGAMIVLVSIGGFTYLHHPAYAAQQALVAQHLSSMTGTQQATEMSMPTALGLMLAPGVKGAFCAVLLFGLLSSQGGSLHGLGSSILQDVIMPLRKKAFSPKAHLLALRIAVFSTAIFVCVMSILYKPVDYLVMITTLIGSIYFAGAAAVWWGGLYWKKATTAGAWTAMLIGTAGGIGFNLLQEVWGSLNALLASLAGPGAFADYLHAHADKFPFNGMELTLFTCVCAVCGFIGVSLLTCRQDFNLDEMLHRGKYKVQEVEPDVVVPLRKNSWLYRFLNINENFTKGDRFITILTFFWTVWWKSLAVGIVTYTLVFGHLSKDWWFGYTLAVGIGLPVVLGVITTIWFTIGVTHDLIELVRTLRTVKRSDADDGRVIGHHNAGDPLARAGGAK